VLIPWREAAQIKKLAWNVSISEPLPEVYIDQDRIAQALGNLLSNAIKYTPNGGLVNITITSSSSEEALSEAGISLEVSNSGPTISSDEQKRIFTPFYRGKATTRFPQGMGLGLTIARDLVSAHGGYLNVKSDPHTGNHFTIWLPAVQEVQREV
jgi:two-component system sensor histidine kinase VicK